MAFAQYWSNADFRSVAISVALRPSIWLRSSTGSWATLGEPGAAGARFATAWGNGIAWARPATNGTGIEIAYAQIESNKLLLKWFDWFVIIFYLVSMLGMGLYFYLRQKRNSTADFFVGGRKIPFWAVGISLYAANTSSISYIAIPAKAFETNWQYLTNNLVGVLGLMFVAVWIVPVLRRLDLMSVFHYLETRFHPVIRTLASALYITVQIGSRMSVILFLPSLAIATMTGIDVTWSILIMGAFTMIYTALGGMKAVVWTDFVQLIVKMGGIAFAIAFIILALDGGAGELFKIAAAEEKMKLFDFSFDLTKATVWGFVFLVLFDVVLTFPKDQVLMQRVLSTKNSKDASRSIWTFAEEARRAGASVRWVPVDMRELPFEREFAGMYSYFTSFGYFSDSENERVIANLARALVPGGRFLIDMGNRDWILTHPQHRTWTQREDGALLMEEMSLDLRTSRVVSRQTLIEPEGGTRVHKEFELRVYTCGELTALFARHGLEVRDVWGGLDRAPYSTETRRLILVAVRV